MSPFSTAIALLALIASALSVHAADAPGAPKPNILLIVADDLGYSDLGCYGSEIRTPHLDQLAERGVRLTQFTSTGRCCPSRASILTGHYPHRVELGHMTFDAGQPGYRGRLAEHAPTMAEVLAPAGYRAFISGKWHLGTKDPTQHGFEEFYGTLVSASTFWDPERYIRLPTGRPNLATDPKTFYGTDALTDHALAFIDLARETPDRPWFLYLAYNAPHFPLHARAEDIEKYAHSYERGWDQVRAERFARMRKLGVIAENAKLSPRSRYWNYGETVTDVNPAWETLSAERQADVARRMAIFAAMIDRMDQNIGRLTGDLREHGELENTLIVFVSDNGGCAEWDPFGFDTKSSNHNILHRGDELQQMGQPGSYHSVGSGWANVSNTPFRLYKHFCHQGGIASPCIVHWPAGLKAQQGTLCHAPAHLIDLLPTAQEVSGAKYPAKRHDLATAPLPGVSLLPLIRDKKSPERTLYFEHEGHRGLRRGKWKLAAVRNAEWELYDLSADPTELHNLAAEQPDLLRELAAAWDRWAEENHVTPFPQDYGYPYLKGHGQASPN